MLLIKSKWIFEGEQMMGKEVDDGWEEHLKQLNIKYEKVGEKKIRVSKSIGEN